MSGLSKKSQRVAKLPQMRLKFSGGTLFSEKI
jgi:hypothetical protein